MTRNHAEGSSDEPAYRRSDTREDHSHRVTGMFPALAETSCPQLRSLPVARDLARINSRHVDDIRIRLLLELQSGVVSRAQLLDHGLSDSDIRRMVRRRLLVRVHPGVYVDHSGPLTWLQRAWAAVLACAPAALRDASAVRAAEGPGRREHDDERPIQVAIDHSRRVLRRPGIAMERVVGLADQVLWNVSPPRQRIEHAAIRLAASCERDIDAVAHLADAVGARLTTGARLAEALDSFSRIGRRDFLASVIADVGAGTCSTLEHGYLTRVERPHGLPTAHRQFRESSKGPLFRDALYERLGLIVELDGRMFHSKSRRHDEDLERDLDAAISRRLTVRLGWGQVFDRSCSTAFKVGAVAVARGWDGCPTRCPDCPDGLSFAA